jgi:hypothetical protein
MYADNSLAAITWKPTLLTTWRNDKEKLQWDVKYEFKSNESEWHLERYE